MKQRKISSNFFIQMMKVEIFFVIILLQFCNLSFAFLMSSHMFAREHASRQECNRLIHHMEAIGKPLQHRTVPDDGKKKLPFI